MNLTIQEAADTLNVSQPCTKVGSYQYIRFEDLMKYKQQRDIQRREGLRELIQFLQEEGFYEDDGVKVDS